MSGGRAGCLGVVELGVLCMAWMILTDVQEDSGAELAVALGMGALPALACWAVLHRLQSSQARTLGDGSAARGLIGPSEPRADPLYEDIGCLRTCALLLLFQDLRATVLQRVLEMDDDRFQAALTRLKGQLVARHHLSS